MSIKQNLFFILGRADPEMNTIAKILKEYEHPFIYAEMNDNSGRRVYSSTAYKANLPAAKDVPAGAKLVWIECHPDVAVANPNDIIIDHHRPGDPGFGKPPAQYWEGSSIGQLCILLGVEPTQEYKIVAAADHCLAAAYMSECPGIDAMELFRWRVFHRAAYQGISESELKEQMLQAAKEIIDSKKVMIGKQEIADFTYFPLPKEAAEGSIMAGIPVMSKIFDRSTELFKFSIISARPETIKTWMEETAVRLKLVNIYGDPARGYAGGYRKNEF